MSLWVGEVDGCVLGAVPEGDRVRLTDGFGEEMEESDQKFLQRKDKSLTSKVCNGDHVESLLKLL